MQLEAAGALIDIGAKTTAFMAAREVRRCVYLLASHPSVAVLLVLGVQCAGRSPIHWKGERVLCSIPDNDVL